MGMEENTPLSAMVGELERHSRELERALDEARSDLDRTRREVSRVSSRYGELTKVVAQKCDRIVALENERDGLSRLASQRQAENEELRWVLLLYRMLSLAMALGLLGMGAAVLGGVSR